MVAIPNRQPAAEAYPSCGVACGSDGADQAPDFRYGVARPPAPETTSTGLISYSPGGGNPYVVYAKAPQDHKIIAGDLLHYLGTEAGQTTWALSDGAADPAWSPKALKTAQESPDLRPQDKASFAIYDDLLRLGPSPQLRNPDVDQVQLALKPVTPSAADIVSGVLTGQIDDAKRALIELDSQSERALDAAIKTARRRGAKVAREDWHFPDWNPTEDYKDSQY